MHLRCCVVEQFTSTSRRKPSTGFADEQLGMELSLTDLPSVYVYLGWCWLTDHRDNIVKMAGVFVND